MDTKLTGVSCQKGMPILSDSSKVIDKHFE